LNPAILRVESVRQPFYLGIGIAIIGLLLSVLVIRETRGHVALEAPTAPHGPRPPGSGASSG
jgi:hypothetical protein